MKKNAFTLAEVLITLTIIGVIAAITIPNLMQSWRKHERISQIKTAYSIMQNTVKLAIAEHGDTYTWDWDGSYDFAEKYVVPYLKIQKKCGTKNKKISSGCFKDDNWFYLNGDMADGNEWYVANTTQNYMVKLENGMSLAIYAPVAQYKDWYHGNSSISNIRFLFDVNGGAGTSTVGIDMFSFDLIYYNGKILTTNLTTIAGECNPDSSKHATGLNCISAIEKNHWEFPDNYPIKKF